MIILKKYLFLLILVIPFYANPAEAMENDDKPTIEESQNYKINSSPVSQNTKEADQSHQWGETTWTFDEGHLQVSGGSIDLDKSKAPWQDNRISSQEIKEIEFTDDVQLKGDASYLFLGLTNLEQINVEKLDVSEVVAMNLMFGTCSKLSELNVTTWNTTNVKTMSFMFQGVSELKSLDLSNWDTSNVSTNSGMFMGATNLIEIKLGSRSIFQDNIGVLPDLEGYRSNWLGLTTGEAYASFSDLISNYDGSSPDTFLREKKIVKDWGTTKYDFFDGVLTVTGGEIDLGKDSSPWKTNEIDASQIKEIRFTDTVYLKGDASYLFSKLPNLNFINAEKLNVTQVTTMQGMFTGSAIFSLNLSEWDTSNVQDMSLMFMNMPTLFELDTANWNTSNVRDMRLMFSNLSILKELNIEDWDTSGVENMSYMFFSSERLKAINLNNWNTSNVRNMSYMFARTFSLKEIYINSWDISNTNDMSFMFLETLSLEKLDISNWDLSGKNTEGMFLFSNISGSTPNRVDELETK